MARRELPSASLRFALLIPFRQDLDGQDMDSGRRAFMSQDASSRWLPLTSSERSDLAESLTCKKVLAVASPILQSEELRCAIRPLLFWTLRIRRWRL